MDVLKSFVETANAKADLRRYKILARAVAKDFDRRRLRILDVTAELRSYVNCMKADASDSRNTELAAYVTDLAIFATRLEATFKD